VGGLLQHYEDTPGKKLPAILVSQDNRVLDGHHGWGMAASVAIDDPGLKIPILRVMLPTRAALVKMHTFGKVHGIARKAIGERTVKIAAHADPGWVLPEPSYRDKLLLLGGAGSGNFGHAGRPGEVGGSAPGGGDVQHGISIAITDKAQARADSLHAEGAGPELARYFAIQQAGEQASADYIAARDIMRARRLQLEAQHASEKESRIIDIIEADPERAAAAASAKAAFARMDELEKAEQAQRVVADVEIGRNLASSVARDLGVDPGIIHVVDKEPRAFKVGDQEFTEGGHFRPSTGEIEINIRGFNVFDAAGVKGIVAHEAQHVIYHAVKEAADAERDRFKALAYDKDYNPTAWANEHLVSTMSGTKIKPEHVGTVHALFPALAASAPLNTNGNMLAGLDPQVVKENGHTPYAKSYWTKEGIAQRGHTYETAVNETLAEVTRWLTTPVDKWTTKTKPKASSPWVKTAKNMHAYYKNRPMP
jgi:hypothetical protein